MKTLPQLFENNQRWSTQVRKVQPDFFSELAAQQKPEYLWIGCADSRVPANEIVGLLPGELFVHRNVANQVIHADLNCLSVLQFAVDELQVRHVIVCGHYGCGGVKAAMEDAPHGLVDNWLGNIRDLYLLNRADLDRIPDVDDRVSRLCELNVKSQVINVGNTTVLREAWARGQSVNVHGWIYSLSDGLLQDLAVGVANRDEVDALQNGGLLGSS